MSADGKDLSRATLEPATAQFARIATGAWANGSAQVPGFARLAPTLSEYQAETAKAAPRPAAAGGRGKGPRPGPPAEQWNALQIIVDTDMVWVSLNGRQAVPNSATRDHMMGYGPIALHVAGSGA